MKSSINGVCIESVATCLPRRVQKLDEKYLGISQLEISKIKKITGIEQVRHVDGLTTASDLCFEAALLLREKNPTSFGEIDAIVYVSQTRDYILPNTSSILQEKLSLGQDCLAIDLPNGCSGYIHGLLISSLLVSSGAARKVLLVCGDTSSRMINRRDKSVSMIFGDAGSATLLGKGEPTSGMYFNLKTNGANFDRIIIPHGGFREPANADSSLDRREGDNFRSQLDMRMDGMSVFNFAITEVPRLILESMEDCNIRADELDLLALHQANLFITTQLAKKSKVDIAKAPFSSSMVGNTGPASIPFLLSEGHSKSLSLKKVLMCGFGVGLNWGCCYADLSHTLIYPPFDRE